jgi:NAD(P)-dependent dehydrogenase (short-subunit alcohol dehydrogenase family)
MLAIVTGGTAGIGRHIAAALAAHGATVIVTGRDPDRGAEAAADINGRFIAVDHTSVSANAELASRLRDEANPVDILVNNVGALPLGQPAVTDEGHEVSLAVNYLGPVTLTDGLLPLLAPGAHVVNVVSSAYAIYRGDPFTAPEPYVGIVAHGRAKQLHLLATLSLARRLGDGALVNAVNPGMAWTPGTQALTRESVPQWRLIWPIVRFFQRRASAQRAATAPVAWALRPPSTGRYVESDGKPRPLPDRLTDPALQDRAWRYPVEPR